MKKIILSFMMIAGVSAFAQTNITVKGYEGTIDVVSGDKLNITEAPGNSMKEKVVNIEINGKTKMWINTTTETIENYKTTEQEKDAMFGDGFVKFVEEGDNYFISELKQGGTGKTVYWLKYIVTGKSMSYIIQPKFKNDGYTNLDEVKLILKYAQSYKPTN
jgi:hypothetical protein